MKTRHRQLMRRRGLGVLAAALDVLLVAAGCGPGSGGGTNGAAAGAAIAMIACRATRANLPNDVPTGVIVLSSHVYIRDDDKQPIFPIALEPGDALLLSTNSRDLLETSPGQVSDNQGQWGPEGREPAEPAPAGWTVPGANRFSVVGDLPSQQGGWFEIGLRSTCQPVSNASSAPTARAGINVDTGIQTQLNNTWAGFLGVTLQIFRAAATAGPQPRVTGLARCEVAQDGITFGPGSPPGTVVEISDSTKHPTFQTTLAQGDAVVLVSDPLGSIETSASFQIFSPGRWGPQGHEPIEVATSSWTMPGVNKYEVVASVDDTGQRLPVGLKSNCLGYAGPGGPSATVSVTINADRATNALGTWNGSIHVSMVIFHNVL